MFRRYQEEMNAVIKSKNAMIEERRPFFRESPVVQTELTGEKKDVESLKAAMQSMTEKMISIQKSLDEQGTRYRPNMQVERSRSSQYNSQCVALQLKLAQEKAAKSTNSTIASLAAARPSPPADPVSTLPPRGDDGYSTFLARYQTDMKHLDDQLASLTSRYQQASAEWVLPFPSIFT